MATGVQSARRAPVDPPARTWSGYAELRRLPLFYKLLVANVGLIALLLLAVHWQLGDGSSATPMLVAAGGLTIVCATIVNGVLIRLALVPLRDLEEAADRVRAGDLDARVEVSPLADRGLGRLTSTFNDVLDRAAADRRRVGELAGRAIQAAEEERARLALTLTDHLAQNLAALLVQVRIVRSAVDVDLRAVLLARLGRDLTAAVEQVRNIAQELSTPPLDLLAPHEALEAAIKQIERETGLRIAREIRRLDSRVSRETALALYRIVQESLLNAARHSGAAQVRVHVAAAGEAIEVAIRDDGCGFDVQRVLRTPGTGLGLLGIRERAAYVGGSAEIRSEPGRGTSVVAQLPLHRVA